MIQGLDPGQSCVGCLSLEVKDKRSQATGGHETTTGCFLFSSGVNHEVKARFYSGVWSVECSIICTTTNVQHTYFTADQMAREATAPFSCCPLGLEDQFRMCLCLRCLTISPITVGPFLDVMQFQPFEFQPSWSAVQHRIWHCVRDTWIPARAHSRIV